MEDPVEGLQEQGGDGQVAHLLHLKVPVHLLKSEKRIFLYNIYRNY